MSVSGVDSSSSLGISQEMLEEMRKAREQGQSPEEFASSLVENGDSDGDSLLSYEESGFSEEHFSEIDADGDGLISADDILQDMQNKMEEHRQMMGELNVLMQDSEEESSSLLDELLQESEEESSSLLDDLMSAVGNSSSSDSESSSGVEGSSSGSSSEEYDAYDLNQDGEVTIDELLQAFQSGASGLSDLFGNDENELGVSSLVQRLAMEAYSSQSI